MEHKNADGTTVKLEMPTTSNVLQYYTANETKVSIRPSGTEPKIKFYLEVHDKMNSKDEYDALMAKAQEKIAVIMKELGI